MPPKRTASPESDSGTLMVIAPLSDLPDDLDELRRWRDRKRNDARAAAEARRDQLYAESRETEQAAWRRMAELTAEAYHETTDRLTEKHAAIEHAYRLREEEIRAQMPAPWPSYRLLADGIDHRGISRKAGEIVILHPDQWAARAAAGEAVRIGTARFAVCRRRSTVPFGTLVHRGGGPSLETKAPMYNLGGGEIIEIDPQCIPQMAEALGNDVVFFDTYAAARSYKDSHPGEVGSLISGLYLPPDSEAAADAERRRADIERREKAWEKEWAEGGAAAGEKHRKEWQAMNARRAPGATPPPALPAGPLPGRP
jgi:hypothetical protein